MLNRVRGLLLFHVLAQTGIALVLLWLLIAVAWTFGFRKISGADGMALSSLIAAAFGVYLFESTFSDLNVLELAYRGASRASWLQTLFVSVAMLGYLVAVQRYAPAPLVIVFLGLLFPIFWCSNRYLPRLLGREFFSSRWRLRTLLCGYEEDLPSLQPWIDRKTNSGMQILGIIPIQPPEHLEVGDPFAATLNQLRKEIERLKINQVIVTRKLPSEQLQRLGNLCIAAGPELYVVIDPARAEDATLERIYASPSGL